MKVSTTMIGSTTNPSHSQHTFHIPVLGTGFSVDTPLRVARYGISSVITIADDTMIEDLRHHYAAKYGEPYTPIHKFDDDWRARRITEYLNLVDRIVRQQFAALRASEFTPGSEITKYFALLPDTAPLKQLYLQMLSAHPSEKNEIQTTLREQILPGWINVNIMTKVDRINVDAMCEPLPEIYSDALSSLRGYANSTLESGMVLSAGLNRRLFAYFSEFPDFFANEMGRIKKQIILKVSDYRSAVIQGKFFAKKGLWVSEYRMESGVNCGGHAFAGNGNLTGPVLAEISAKRHELGEELSRYCREALKAQNKPIPETFVPFRVTAQGGIGTAAEDTMLRRLYDIDSTGWGTPFLLVPEATQVEPYTLKKLQEAKENDIYLSSVSPLGVPFHNLKVSKSELNKQKLIDDGNAGSPCPLGHLVSNTEFTEQPICTASRQYQALKIAELKSLSLPADELEERTLRVLAKACICSDLGDTAYILNEIPKPAGLFPAICPGPNIAYYDRVASLREMVDHIYGRGNLLQHQDRPHMFVKELNLNIDFLANLIHEVNTGFGNTKDSDLEDFRANLDLGIDYYLKLVPSLIEETAAARNRILLQLEACRQRLKTVMTSLLEVSSRRVLTEIPEKKQVSTAPLFISPASFDPAADLTLLVASHSGNGRSFARRVATLANELGLRINVMNMGTFPPTLLMKAKNLIAIISTYGEGEPPVAAEVLFEYLKNPKAERLDHLRFSVLGLGDKSYIHFCKAGVDLDRMLASLGAQRLFKRVDGDVDYNAEAVHWLIGVVKALLPPGEAENAKLSQLAASVDDGYSARRPYWATVLTKANLNGPGSTKETYHIELALEDSRAMEHHPGDACGVVSQNSDALVKDVLAALQATGSDLQGNMPILTDVLKVMELTVLAPSVIVHHNAFARSPELDAIIADDEKLRAFIYGRDFIDLLREYPIAYTFENLIEVLRPAPPRLFSITSAQVCHPEKLTLLVGVLRYTSQGRAKAGMASTALADRVNVGDRIPIFIRPNEGFRMPEDQKARIIMIGAGTGVAPFRAYLQKRALLPKCELVGKSWLFFGNPHVATDFLYNEELNGFLKNGTLTRLTTAFSRDQEHKVYVNHKILEHAQEIYAWLSVGAKVYVSGGKEMARDVFAALVECARRCGALSEEAASDYSTQLRRSGQYVEDVYS